MRISLYDTTLRDGVQGEGITFSEDGKMRFVHLLDDLGIDFIEGGFAGSNPRDRRFFTALKRESLSHAKIVAFGLTRRADLTAGEDPQLADLLAAETEWVAIYGKCWMLHVQKVLGTTAETNLAMIADSIRYLREKGRQVLFDAEHFFDGYQDDPAYALKVVETAFAAGTAGIVLCDTNGGTLPHAIFTATQAACDRLPNCRIGIHTHNDTGMAVANAIEAVRGGARMVQGCINGYGERTGNADLVTIIPTLACKMGCSCIAPDRLATLRDVSLITHDLTNRRPDPQQPYVGQSAFSHKAGTHVNAVAKDPRTFEHIDPAVVGNSRHVLVSELSGVSNLRMKAQELGEDLSTKSREELRTLLERIKHQENLGYSYESADGSLKLLLHRALGDAASAFAFEGFRVIVEIRGPGEPCISEATIKVKVNDETALTAGEGSGPVDALNAALRRALTRFYPEINDMALTDYRVRILDPQQATRATTRVLIESGDATRQWGTVGVSENIIEASWQALLDSVEYLLLKEG